MRKIPSPEEERRGDVDLDKFSQVLWGNASDDLMAERDKLFVFNSLFYGKPVHLLESK